LNEELLLASQEGVYNMELVSGLGLGKEAQVMYKFYITCCRP